LDDSRTCCFKNGNRRTPAAEEGVEFSSVERSPLLPRNFLLGRKKPGLQRHTSGLLLTKDREESSVTDGHLEIAYWDYWKDMETAGGWLSMGRGRKEGERPGEICCFGANHASRAGYDARVSEGVSVSGMGIRDDKATKVK